MTPTEINDAARDLYNAVGDTFFTDAQMYNWQWMGCHDLARKAQLIEAITTTATVASTQAVSYPTNAIAIKRITVNGSKIKPITMRDDDSVTLSNQASATLGKPTYYYDFAYTVYLRPIPDDVYTVQIFSFNDHPVITASTTLLIPTLFHLDIVDYLLSRMFAKDKDIESANYHMGLWATHVKEAVSYKKRLKRADGFATVQSEDILPVTIIGAV